MRYFLYNYITAYRLVKFMKVLMQDAEGFEFSGLVNKI